VGDRPTINGIYTSCDIGPTTPPFPSATCDPRLLSTLQDASDADYFLNYALTTEPADISADSHPLATWVVKRSLADMLAWPLTGKTPPALATVPRRKRRGPVADRPTLSLAERRRFFEHLMGAADRSRTGTDQSQPTRLLLRRQTYYFLAWSTEPGIDTWLRATERHHRIELNDLTRWTPSWAAARSLMVARARLGDPEPLRDFVRKAIASDACHAANLNYWAYWIGETPATHHTDDFMAANLGDWRAPCFSGACWNASLRTNQHWTFTPTPCGRCFSDGRTSSNKMTLLRQHS
jgi:hypothetical protein